MEKGIAKSTAENDLMSATSFVIEADEVDSMVKRSGFTTAMELLPTLVPAAQALARPPISNFLVGAVGLGSSGAIYFGVNLEFPGLPLHHSVHAEQFLVTNAAVHGEKRLSHIAVSALPCGHCRQFLQEIRGASEIQIHVTSDGQDSAGFRPLTHFLPHPFGPRDLLGEDAPLLLEPHRNSLIIFDEEERDGSGDRSGAICNGEEGSEAGLKRAALRAARGSHAPYSGCPSGFAVEDGKGIVYGGGYAESAAYNPSVGPVQAALIAYVAGGGGGGGGGYEDIVNAALVEKANAVVSHEGTARILMAAVAPRCRLRIYRC